MLQLPKYYVTFQGLDKAFRGEKICYLVWRVELSGWEKTPSHLHGSVFYVDPFKGVQVCSRSSFNMIDLRNTHSSRCVNMEADDDTSLGYARNFG